MRANNPYLPFWAHVEELRRTFVQMLLIVACGFVICLYFYQPLIHVLTQPLTRLSHFQQGWQETLVFHKQLKNASPHEQILHLPPHLEVILPLRKGVTQKNQQTYSLAPFASIQVAETSPLVLLTPMEGFATVIKLSFWFGLVATSPFWLFTLLRFIAPAFINSIRKQFWLFFLLFVALFYAGLLCAYFATIPLANQYFFAFSTGIGMNLWNLGSYMEYTLLLLLGNGLGFELSGILFLLIHLQMIELGTLYRMRRYAYVGIFILSALLTPPDILSQILLAVPLIALYEAGILQARWKQKHLPLLTHAATLEE
ncbi:MAG: twin-arginine translocase subunit TatC [Parachlamydia sp.]|nr:MAG: twin-arginine translocase subunit TatC [Parachlamydia sp.]